MNEKKIITAFSRIKKDMDFLKKEIKNLQKGSKEKFVKNDNQIIDFENLITKNSVEITNLKEKFNMKNDYLKNKDFEGKFSEFQEMINEKISLELASLRMEFVTELNNSKTEIKTEIKTDVKKNIDKNIESEIIKKKDKTIKPKKRGEKLKKIAKWLFIDEDEEEFNSIKSEVKKGKKEK